MPEPTDPTHPPAPLPLTGVRVLDLSRILAGPHAAMVLGDLGAEVLKVERSGTGDETRRWGPPFHGPDAVYFHAVNRNRRSVTLDFAAAEDRETLRELVAWADVVIENFMPRQYRAFGLEAIRSAHPDVVWVSVRGAGENGPLADLPGLDAMVQGRAGIMSLTGTAESGPTKAGVPVADLMTGMYAAVAALAGLRGRDVLEGAVPRYQVPLFESALTALVPYGAQYLATGVTPGPNGNGHPTVMPYGLFPVADGHVMVGAASDRQFAALCTAAGVPELTGDPRFRTNADRLANRVALDALLGDVFGGLSRTELIDRLESAGVPCAPVNSVADALEEQQVRSTGLVQRVDTPSGPLSLIGTPILIDGRRPPIRTAPPLLGADDDVVPAEGRSTEPV